jgi:hypothetical protein
MKPVLSALLVLVDESVSQWSRIQQLVAPIVMTIVMNGLAWLIMTAREAH